MTETLTGAQVAFTLVRLWREEKITREEFMRLTAQTREAYEEGRAIVRRQRELDALEELLP